MQRIHSSEELRLALRRYRRFQLREQTSRAFVEKYRDMIVRWMETKNRKAVKDDQGNIWQKRQAVRILYPDDAKELRKLLRSKGLDTREVISTVQPAPVTVVSEEAILRLLKEKKITPNEYEAVIIRQTYTPFIVRLNGRRNEKIQIGGKRRVTKSR